MARGLVAVERADPRRVVPADVSRRARGDSDHLGLFVPFSLRIDLLDKMLNFEIADDPTYQGLEIQAFDDAQHGSGVAVFLSRREDGRNDVYRQPGLNLDPHMYEIGSGLGAWTECDFGISEWNESLEYFSLCIRSPTN